MDWSSGFSWHLTVILLIINVGQVELAEQCPQEKLQNCLNMAYSFLENDRFTFPTTKADVEDVCNSWSKFLDCIEGYVADCLDDRQKSDFKQNVDSILDSVRNLCTDASYQEQYFQHAECIKKTCTDDAYCGIYYKQMTRQVSQDFNTNELCCNYRKFDRCVNLNTNAICGSTARDFAVAMLNKAMNFLAARCRGNSQASLDNCLGANEISVGPTYSVTNAGPGIVVPSSRALPVDSTSPTTRWSYTKGPESLAYGNDVGKISGHLTIVMLLCSISLLIAIA